jgi:hypothetical protein
MGYEYKLRFEQLDEAEFRDAMLAAPSADYDAATQFYNFRDPDDKSTESGWPSLSVKIDPDGIYLWHCGNRKFFEAMVEHLRGKLTGSGDLEEL